MKINKDTTIGELQQFCINADQGFDIFIDSDGDIDIDKCDYIGKTIGTYSVYQAECKINEVFLSYEAAKKGYYFDTDQILDVEGG